MGQEIKVLIVRVWAPVTIALTLLSATPAYSVEPEAKPEPVGAKYMDFLRATAKATALAKTKYHEAVKFLALGENESGAVMVLGMALTRDHGASLQPPSDATALAHVHHRKMANKPESADFDALRQHQLQSFIISADGEHIWEIAINDESQQYRAIHPSGVGEWITFQSGR